VRVPLPEVIPPAESLRRVHFVGIGGAALSGLARIFAARGVSVSGSDSCDSVLLDALRDLGVRCFVGHDAGNVGDAEVVVVSTAIRADNPEAVTARERGIAVWPRSAAVQSVLLGRTAIVVTGTHGKTTTTSMLVTALLRCGADPSYAIGSTLTSSGQNAAEGTGRLFVVEGDESDGAVLAYTPAGAIVTNIDADHLDVYRSSEAYADVFEAFLDRIETDGFLICCVDDPGAARLAARADGRAIRVVRVGRREGADLRMRELQLHADSSRFDVTAGAVALGSVSLRVPGEIYAVDALAALAAGLELGFRFADLADGLAAFEGSARRMERKGEAAGVTVYDSYAHHPAEIAGDVAVARLLARDGRLVVCFQPHLYSRTRVFGEEMGRELGAADDVIVLDVYAAREERDPDVTGALVASSVPLPPDRVVFEPDSSQAAEQIVRRTGPGDLVLTLGAGDVTEIGPQVLSLLSRAEQEGADRATAH
jgi:UDP-N-acetylmuramate--alanine ligase